MVALQPRHLQAAQWPPVPSVRRPTTFPSASLAALVDRDTAVVDVGSRIFVLRRVRRPGRPRPDYEDRTNLMALY